MTAETATSKGKRLSPEERRSELLQCAVDLALESGLARVTARRVAQRAGVAQGLVTHHFGSIDSLIAATFEHVAAADRPMLSPGETPLESVQRLIGYWLSHGRDAEAILWLDAWRESAHRPAVRQAVVKQMERDIAELGALIERGIATGEFPRATTSTAMRVLALIDGLSANAAVRAGLEEPLLDYDNATAFIRTVIESELGVRPGVLGSTHS